MAVLITCQSDKDLIKNEIDIVLTTFSEGTGNYHAKSPNRPKIKLVQDFMSVSTICKFDEDPIKNEVTIIGTTFSPSYV